MSRELDVNVNDVLRMVKEEGKTRKEIAAHYGISLKACKEQIFTHPDLKGIRKPQESKAVKINLIAGDTQTLPSNEEENHVSDTTESVQAETQEETEQVEHTGVQESNLAEIDLEEEMEETDAPSEEVEEVEEPKHTPHFSADEEEEEAVEETEGEPEIEERPASGVEW